MTASQFIRHRIENEQLANRTVFHVPTPFDNAVAAEQAGLLAALSDVFTDAEADAVDAVFNGVDFDRVLETFGGSIDRLRAVADGVRERVTGLFQSDEAAREFMRVYV